MSTYSILEFKSSELPETYKALVFSKWLRSLRYGSPGFDKIQQDKYFDHYHLYIEMLLKKPDSIIRLAVLTDDNDVVLGFSASREDVLDYVHVHVDQRKQGIAKALIPKNITTTTHQTRVALEILCNNPKYKLIVKDEEKDPNRICIYFNPFA